MRSQFALILAVTCAALATERAASAQNCSASTQTYGAVGGTELAATPVSNLQFIANPVDAVNYVAKGNRVHAIWAATGNGHTKGTIKWSKPDEPFNSPLAGGQPVLVPLGTTEELALIVSAGGFVYRLRASDGAVQAQYNARRSTCGADTILAMPAVILKSSYPSLTDDLVLISTAYSCTPGDRTTNKVIALKGTDLSFQWQSVSTLALDRGVGGSLNYEDGSLYYAFGRPALTPQPSLVRLNVTNGSHVWNGASWTIDAGPITSVPQLRAADNRIFVGTQDALIKAYDVNTRVQTLSFAIANSSMTSMTQSLVLGRGGGFDNMVLATTQDGYVRGVVVTLANAATSYQNIATLPWAGFRPGNVFASSPPVLNSKISKIYASTVAGSVYQYNATNALQEAYTTVGNGTVSQPALDVSGTSAAANVLITSAYNTAGQTNLTQNCIPWAIGSAGGLSNARAGGEGGDVAAPLTDGTPCGKKTDCSVAQFGGDATGAPNFRVRACINGACSSLPTNEGGECELSATEIGASCGTAHGISVAGTCAVTSTDTSDCVCDTNSVLGGPGCADGEFCTGPLGLGCVNLNEDPANCGTVGHQCGNESGSGSGYVAGSKCIAGHCVVHPCEFHASISMLNGVVDNWVSEEFDDNGEYIDSNGSGYSGGSGPGHLWLEDDGSGSGVFPGYGTPTAVTVAWGSDQTDGVCDYLVSFMGHHTDESDDGSGSGSGSGSGGGVAEGGGIGRFGGKGENWFISEDGRSWPTSISAAVDDKNMVFATNAKSNQTLGDLVYIKSGELGYYNDGVADTTRLVPFAEEYNYLNSGPIGSAIIKLASDSIIVVAGNYEGNGIASFVKLALQGDTWIPDGGPQTMFTAPTGASIVGTAYSQPRPEEYVDGKAWAFWGIKDGAFGITSYCDAQMTNFGLTCKNPGVKDIWMPPEFEQIIPASAIASTGDLTFVAKVNGLWELYYIGEDLQPIPARKLHESIGLSYLEPQEEPFTVTGLPQGGLLMYLPGTLRSLAGNPFMVTPLR